MLALSGFSRVFSSSHDRFKTQALRYDIQGAWLLQVGTCVQFGEGFPELCAIVFKRAEEENPELAISLQELLVQLETVHPGHPDVEDGRVVDAGHEILQRRPRVRERIYLEAMSFQSVFHGLRDVRLVVDYQDSPQFYLKPSSTTFPVLVP